LANINLVKIGFISKTHGFNGLVKLGVDEHFEEALTKAKFLFLSIDSYQIPFYIEKIELSNTITCKLEDVDSKESAQQYVGTAISLERKFVPDIEDNEEYNFLQGYMVLNREEQIGVLKEVQEFPEQLMAIIIAGEGELMIPLHENLIRNIDNVKKQLVFDLPEGLLDLNS